MAMGFGTFMPKLAVVTVRKKAANMVLNVMIAFIPTPLLEGHGYSELSA